MDVQGVQYLAKQAEDEGWTTHEEVADMLQRDGQELAMADGVIRQVAPKLSEEEIGPCYNSYRKIGLERKPESKKTPKRA
jgi:hypothetical protein